MNQRVIGSFLVALILIHLFALVSISPFSSFNSNPQIFIDSHRLDIPDQETPDWSSDEPWWTWTSMDLDRNKIDQIVKDAEEESRRDNIDDQKRYLIDQKIEVLKNLNLN